MKYHLKIIFFLIAWYGLAQLKSETLLALIAIMIGDLLTQYNIKK